MFKRLFSVVALAAISLSLGGCWLTTAVSTAQNASSTPVPQSAIDAAKATVLGINSLYGVAVVLADDYAKQPPCGQPNSSAPPFCASDPAVVAIAKVAKSMRVTLVQSKQTVLSASPTQSELDLAVMAAQNAWDAYKQVAAIYNIKTGA